MSYTVHKVNVVAPDGWTPQEEGDTYWQEMMAAAKPYAILPTASETFNAGEYLLYWQNDPAGPMAVYAITAVDAATIPGSAICTLAQADPFSRADICRAAAGISEPVVFL